MSVVTGVFSMRPSLDAATVGGFVHFAFAGQAAAKIYILFKAENTNSSARLTHFTSKGTFALVTF